MIDKVVFKNIKPELAPLIDGMHFELVSQCWCGGKLKVWLPEFDDYLECISCGCKSVRYRLTDESIKEFYEHQYWYDYQTLHACPSVEERYEADMVDRIPSYLEWIRQLCPVPARVLEIGCGNGRLSHELARAGYDICATEMDPNVAQWVKEKTGIPVVAGDFPPIDQPPYDLIIVIDVLEHISNPISFIHDVTSRLGHGGHVFLHCPVMDTDEQAHTLRHLYNPLSHIWMHTSASMSKLWQRAGWTPEKIGELFCMPCFDIAADTADKS